MRASFFELDSLALFFLLIFAFILFFFWRKTLTLRTAPHLLFSNLMDLKSVGQSLKAKFAGWPRLFKLTSLLLFMSAFIDPHMQIKKRDLDFSNSSEGIAIYLVLDRSSSMNEKITYSNGGRRQSRAKLDLLKEVTAKFIEGDSQAKLSGHPHDLIGLVVFARTGEIISPLTLDHTYLLKKLPQITTPSQAEDGTAIGYAIFKTVNLIAATRHYANDLNGSDLPAYDIKNAIIVLVTDGLQAPNPLDEKHALRSMGVDEAAEYAKKNDVKLYIINLEPRLSGKELAPFRRQMEAATELTGGKLYLWGSSENLEQIYQDIDQLEKSTLPEQQDLKLKEMAKDHLPQFYRRVSFYPYLIALGLIFLFVGTVLETTILRKMP